MESYPLNVPTPRSFSYVKRNIPDVTVEQRERVLKATHYNEFAFPAGMLTIDMLSDSGTTAMTDQQWSAMILGDESYGRNKGYYVLLDTFRDIFERGGEKNWKKIIDLVRTDCKDIEKMMKEMYLCEYSGGFFNGGAAQLERPNSFIIQQGRAAEAVLMEIVRNILNKRYPGKNSPFHQMVISIPQKETLNKWAQSPETFSEKTSSSKSPKAVNTQKILSKVTWIVLN